MQDPELGNSTLVEGENKMRSHNGIAHGQTDRAQARQNFNTTNPDRAMRLHEELSEGSIHR
jgi:hypothetical protein